MLNNFLAILRPGGEPGEVQRIARSNGIVPLLWEILLADASPALTAELQQVLGAAAATSVVTDAGRALARLQRFTLLMQPYEPLERIPALRRYLDGAQQHLRDLAQAWSLDNEPPPVLCLNLAELSSSDAAAQRVSTTDQVLHFGEQWQRLERTLAAGDVSMLEERLRFPSLNLDYTHWKTWAGQFGLALFRHDYFDRAFRSPLDGEYADHEYDALGADDDLGNGIHRYREQGKWGVLRRDASGDTILLAAQWDRVLRAGAAEQELVWIKRGERFGLAAIAGEHAGRVLLDPMLDEAGPFHDGLAIARTGARSGFLARDGKWRLQPAWDEAWPFEHGYAAVISDDRLGFIDANGATVVPAQFDAADDFTPAGVARVRRNGQYGLIRADATFAAPLLYDRLQWVEDFSGWLGYRDIDGESTTILLHADGTRWIDPGWETLEVMVPQHSIQARRANLVGLLHWNGDPLLDCAYDELQARLPASFIARRADRVGLIDAAGAPLIPFEFSAIESLEPHFEDDHCLQRHDLARVWSLPGRSKPLAGIWDLQRQRCIVPCQYDYIWLLLLGDADRYGFVVINENPRGERSVRGKYRVGILRDDGSQLVPQDYAWIGERTALNREEAMHHLRGAIYYAWSRGQPVDAAVERNGAVVGLSPTLNADFT